MKSAAVAGPCCRVLDHQLELEGRRRRRCWPRTSVALLPTSTTETGRRRRRRSRSLVAGGRRVGVDAREVDPVARRAAGAVEGAAAVAAAQHVAGAADRVRRRRRCRRRRRRRRRSARRRPASPTSRSLPAKAAQRVACRRCRPACRRRRCRSRPSAPGRGLGARARGWRRRRRVGPAGSGAGAAGCRARSRAARSGCRRRSSPAGCRCMPWVMLPVIVTPRESASTSMLRLEAGHEVAGWSGSLTTVLPRIVRPLVSPTVMPCGWVPSIWLFSMSEVPVEHLGAGAVPRDRLVEDEQRLDRPAVADVDGRCRGL